jgi:hypothetical protein
MKLQKWRPWVPLTPTLARAVYRCPLCNWTFTVRDDVYGRSVRARVRARLGAHLRTVHPNVSLRERSILSDRLVDGPSFIREERKEKT